MKYNPDKYKKYIHKKYYAKYRRKYPIRYHLTLLKRRGCKLKLKTFEAWYKLQQERCYYCKITIDIIKKIKWGFSHSWGNNPTILFLTIDKKDSKIGYKLSNMCLACSVCNGLKSYFFTEQEFIKIANKYIKPKWKKM